MSIKIKSEIIFINKKGLGEINYWNGTLNYAIWIT